MSKRKEFRNRDRILAKAGHRCSVCNCGCNLHIHHKDFDSSNNSPDNAQVVCGDCHIQLHKVSLESEWDQVVDEVRRKDLETEKAMRAAWVQSGRSLNEIGGEESAEFFSDYLMAMESGHKEI